MDLDWKQVLEVASPVAVIFTAGRISQQIASLREETKALGPIVKEWAAVLVRLGNIENSVARLLSDHRQLKDKVGETREKLASFHEG